MADAGRYLAFHCPLGADTLFVRRMSGTESLGRPFQYDVELLSEQVDIKLEDVLGLNACVRLTAGKGIERFFNGIVADFALTGTAGRYHRYMAVLRPWFWFLTRTVNCRVFQNKTVPEIVMEICRDHGFSDFSDRLHGTYAPREYCVQYRESDFSFMSRLMEEVGIYYYFTHTLEVHTLVLADDHGSHDPAAGFEKVPFQTIVSDDLEAPGQFFDWQVRRRVQSGKFAHRDYDFKKPLVDLLASSADPNEHAMAEAEVYDYPGGHTEVADGELRARLRLEELNTQYEEMRGTTNVRGIGVGMLFELSGHARADQNQEYLPIMAHYHIDGGAYESGDSTSVAYSAVLTSVSGLVRFRPERSTPRPRVPGPQTALVVGPSGSEIWTDPDGYGCVRIQFPWDREGKKDGESSCWVRVSQAWAGMGWGSMHLPHVGDEVVVSFLEGDPDRPLVTGRVYNAANMPWHPLPAKQTTSYFRDVGGNHISMEEGRRIELYTPFGETKLALGAPNSPAGIYMYTELDYASRVLGQEVVTISGPAMRTVEKSQTETVVEKREATIGTDDIKKVMGSAWKFIGGASEEKVLGPLSAKYEGVTFKFTGGSANGLFIGQKHDSFIGIQSELNWSKKFEVTKASVKNDAGKEYVITAVNSGTANGVFDGKGIKLSAGGTKVVIAKDGRVTINSDTQMVLNSKSTIKLIATNGVMIKAPKVTAINGTFETKNIKDRG